MAIADTIALTLAHNLAASVGWSVSFQGVGTGRILLEGPEVNNVSPAVILTYDSSAETAITVGAKITRVKTWIQTMQSLAPVT